MAVVVRNTARRSPLRPYTVVLSILVLLLLRQAFDFETGESLDGTYHHLALLPTTSSSTPSEEGETTVVQEDNSFVQTENEPLLSLNSFPQGGAPNLPALDELDDESINDLRKGLQGHNHKHAVGVGDPKHLGFTSLYDANTISPAVWNLMMQWNIKSVMDVGCGRGWSTLWFQQHSVDASCVEASPDAIRRTVLEEDLVAHDFTRGAWWPNRTYDAVWMADFVQQVSAHHQANYVTALSKAAVVVLTAPTSGGWHHVEVHLPEYWIQRFKRWKFVYEPELTKAVREAATKEAKEADIAPNGQPYNAREIQETALVFTNPRVTVLPNHFHLFNEIGCFKLKKGRDDIVSRECSPAISLVETPLHPYFLPPKPNLDAHLQWDSQVREQLERDRLGIIGLPNRGKVTFLHGPPVNRSELAIETIPRDLALGRNVDTEVPVVVWPLWEFGYGNAEAKHVEEDGILQSPYLRMTQVDDFDPNVVWLGDTGYAYGWMAWCNKFEEHINEARKKRSKRGLPHVWPIYIVNFNDHWEHQRCEHIESLMGHDIGQDFVRYFQRAAVRGREWNNATNWVDTGKRFNLAYKDVYYTHTPLIVRTDTVLALQDVLKELKMDLASPIETMERPIDVAHLWPLDGEDVGTIQSNLRTRVSHIIADLGKKSNITTHVALAGSATARAGRREVSTDYVKTLLRTKILVITQRDQWEDHYRLFEGIVMGPMVLTDRMLSLPQGLENGTSVVEFTDEDDLRQKVLYYLLHEKERTTIASNGRKVAMSQHRSWHRMEQIIFGKALTVCSGKPGSKCPYIAHASETD